MRPEWDAYCPSCGLHTPHLDQLVQEGLLFTRAYCQQAICGPSRNSFMSGRRCANPPCPSCCLSAALVEPPPHPCCHHLCASLSRRAWQSRGYAGMELQAVLPLFHPPLQQHWRRHHLAVRAATLQVRWLPHSGWRQDLPRGFAGKFRRADVMDGAERRNDQALQLPAAALPPKLRRLVVPGLLPAALRPGAWLRQPRRCRWVLRHRRFILSLPSVAVWSEHAPA